MRVYTLIIILLAIIAQTSYSQQAVQQKDRLESSFYSCTPYVDIQNNGMVQIVGFYNGKCIIRAFDNNGGYECRLTMNDIKTHNNMLVLFKSPVTALSISNPVSYSTLMQEKICQQTQRVIDGAKFETIHIKWGDEELKNNMPPR